MSRLIGLLDIYDQDELDNEEELLYHLLWEGAETCAFEVEQLDPVGFGAILAPDGSTTVMEAYRDYAEVAQRALVAHRTRNFDEERVIVMQGKRLIDGYHHFMAAANIGRPVMFIDLEKAIEPGLDPAI